MVPGLILRISSTAESEFVNLVKTVATNIFQSWSPVELRSSPVADHQDMMMSVIPRLGYNLLTLISRMSTVSSSSQMISTTALPSGNGLSSADTLSVWGEALTLIGACYNVGIATHGSGTVGGTQPPSSTSAAAANRSHPLFLSLSTMVTYLSQLFRRDRPLCALTLKCISFSCSIGRPMSPFDAILMMLVAGGIPSLKMQAMEGMQKIIVQEVKEKAARKEGGWVDAANGAAAAIESSTNTTDGNNQHPPTLAAPPPVPNAAVQNSSSHNSLASILIIASTHHLFDFSSTISQSLLNLAFSLTSTSPKSVNLKTLSRAGSDIMIKLFNTHHVDNDGEEDLGEGNDDTNAALRRNMMKRLTATCTGRAPNARLHSRVLLSLSPQYLKSYASDLIEWLGHVSGGGYDPKACTESLIPCLGRVLGKAGNTGSIDQAMLFTKKILFAADTPRRVAAANSLTMLLSVVVVKSRPEYGYGHGVSTQNAVDEIIGYLKRSLTQERAVRSEIYSSLLSHLSANDDALEEHITEILCNQLERYFEPIEDPEAAKRRKDGVLSQYASQNDDSDDDEEDGTGLKTSLVLIRNCISDVEVESTKGGGGRKSSSSSANDRSQEDRTFHPALVAAAERVTEPLGQLIQTSSQLAKKTNQIGRLLQSLCGKVANTELDHYMDIVKKNCLENPPNSRRNTFATADDDSLSMCLVVIDMCEALIVSTLDDFSLDSDGNIVGDVEKDYDDDDDDDDDEEHVIMRDELEMNSRLRAMSSLQNLFNLITAATEHIALILLKKNKKKGSKKPKKAKKKKTAKKMKMKGDGQIDFSVNDEDEVGTDGDNDGDNFGETEADADADADADAIAGAENGNAKTDFEICATPAYLNMLKQVRAFLRRPKTNQSFTKTTDFIYKSLCQFGASNEKICRAKFGETQGTQAGEEAGDIVETIAQANLLVRNTTFRRYLLELSLDLLSDESTAPEGIISSSFKLAPLFFTEFIVHCHRRSRTSASSNSAKNSSTLPLAALALECFEKCIVCLIQFGAETSDLAVDMRISSLLLNSFRKTGNTVLRSHFDARTTEALELSKR